MPDGTVKVLIEGIKRVKILEIDNKETDFINCNVETVEENNKNKDSEIYAQNLIKKFEKLVGINKKDFTDSVDNIRKLKDPSSIADNIASNLNLQIFEKQELLELNDLRRRLKKFIIILIKRLA